MNAYSSRSHTILQIQITRKPVSDAVLPKYAMIKRAKLNIIDLAGSETMKRNTISKFTNQRIAELTSINQSLSCLGNCIRALEKGSPHVPYRDSKLTRLLEDSLGGNTKTTFIVTLSPSDISRGETISTLQFADRAKKVTVHAYANEELATGNELIKANHEIQRLRDMLRSLGGGSLVGGSYTNTTTSISQTTLLELQAERKRRKEVENELTELRQQYLSFSNDTSRGRGAVKPLVDRLRQTDHSKKRDTSSSSAPPTTRINKINLDKQRAWNRIYISWLKKCPGVIAEGGGNTVTNPSQLTSRQAKLLTPTQRVTLAEWSLLLQTEELERCKLLLLEEREKIQKRMIQFQLEKMKSGEGGEQEEEDEEEEHENYENYEEEEYRRKTAWDQSPSSTNMPLPRSSPGNESVASHTSHTSRVSPALSSDPGMRILPSNVNYQRHNSEHDDDYNEYYDDEYKNDLDDVEERMLHVEENDEEVGENALMAVRGMLERMKKIDQKARKEKLERRREETQRKMEQEVALEKEEVNKLIEKVEEDDFSQRYQYSPSHITNQENGDQQRTTKDILTLASSLTSQRSAAEKKNISTPSNSSTFGTSNRMLLWKKIFDNNSGHNYYYNRATGASVWERPADFYSAFVPEELAERLRNKDKAMKE